MSGGRFDYNQFRIRDIAEDIKGILEQQGKANHFEKKFNKAVENYPTHPKEIQAEMKKAIKALRIAEIYAHRLDWYLSGDDSEESFFKRMKENFDNLKKEKVI